MDEAFRTFLKRRGKKKHVVEGLVKQVERFEVYLGEERGKGLATAGVEDVQSYMTTLEGQGAGAAGKQVRGLALYYQFMGRPEMAAAINGIREKGIEKQRKVLPLKDFRGVDKEALAKLATVGITNVAQMLAAGKTGQSRQRLSDETGVDPDCILELVKLSDLARLGGLKGVRARLYYEAGVDTPEKIAQWQPEELQVMLADFVKRSGFEGIAPLPKEVRNGVAEAKGLAKIVNYE